MPGLDAHGPDVAGQDVRTGSSLVPHQLLGARYELLRPIARGGMAEVWEGQDAILRRPVAVKVLQTHLSTDPTFVERFRREAVTAARLGHPCIVATYDTGVDAGTAYIVMELVRGQTLRQLLTASAPLDPALAVSIAVQIADALAAAHRAGLVHRDVKPANVLLTDDGSGALRVKVTDFGIAKAGPDAGADLTQTGMVVGTPKYLSPEQVEGRVDPDARSDLYALGVVLFEMLTGRPPFNGPTEMATALSHLRDPAPRVASMRPAVSPGLDAFVAAMLAKAPADRPPTAVAARQALEVMARQGVTARAGSAGYRTPPGGIRSTGGTRPAGDDRRSARTPPGEPRPPALNGPVGHGSWLRPGAGDRPGARPAGLAAAPAEAVTPPTGTPAADRWRPDDRHSRPDDRQPRPDDRRPRPGPARPSSGRVPAVGPYAARPLAGGPPPPDPPPPRRRPRRRRGSGLVLAGVALVAVVVAGIVIAGHGGGKAPTAQTDRPPSASAYPIAGVTVWMDTTAHTPDNPGETGYVFDGNPATAWQTAQYYGAHAAEFGDLYDGEGLAIRLTARHTVVQLVVDSPTVGWAASTYVSTSEPPRGAPVSAWGTPTASASDVGGDHTFRLGGRPGRYVLLWLTNLGPGDPAQVSISEVAVH